MLLAGLSHEFSLETDGIKLAASWICVIVVDVVAASGVCVIFVFLIVVGLAYVWKKGGLDLRPQMGVGKQAAD